VLKRDSTREQALAQTNYPLQTGNNKGLMFAASLDDKEINEFPLVKAGQPTRYLSQPFAAFSSSESHSASFFVTKQDSLRKGSKEEVQGRRC
jgi:hypothetical protein